MKKIIIALLALPFLAHGAANDLLVNQRNSIDSGTLSRTVSIPPAGANGLLGFNGSTVLPVFYTLGSGLTLNAGVLNTAPQVQPDWNAPSGLASIANKPTLSPVATTGAYSSLTGVPTSFPPAAHNQPWSTITAPPTTMAGYGITDGVTQAALNATLGSYATSSALASGLSTKLNAPSGTTAQYVRGDGSLATLPASRRIDTYQSTTDASGLITVVYATPFSSVPSVQPPAPAAANQVWTMVSSTANGFSLRLSQRASVQLLGVEVLLAATTNVAGAPAQIVVVDR